MIQCTTDKALLRNKTYPLGDRVICIFEESELLRTTIDSYKVYHISVS
jgi:hypothetical protein